MKYILAAIALATSSCSFAPMGGMIGNAEDRPSVTRTSGSTRTFTVIDTVPLSPSRVDYRPYSTTSIRTFTVRER